MLQFLQHGDWPIALIIFTASVLVPFGKIMALSWLCLAARRDAPLDMTAQMRLYRITEWVGRWSMIDVFVVAIVVALVRLGNLLSIDPGPGGLAFAAVVVLTMLAAFSFDPRLIWDRQPAPDPDAQPRTMMSSTPSRAVHERLPRLSPVWLIPLAALLIGLWLAFDHLSGQGP